MTRIQKERFFNEEDYLRLKGCYELDEKLLQQAPPTMPVLHPLPRIDEIKPDVDNDPRAAYFDQVHNGVYIRMAIVQQPCFCVSRLYAPPVKRQFWKIRVCAAMKAPVGLLSGRAVCVSRWRGFAPTSSADFPELRNYK